MSQFNQKKLKNNIILYRIKNLDTNLYYKNWIWKDINSSKNYSIFIPHQKDYIFDEVGTFYNTELGARKAISEITGKSYTKYSKMNTAEKILTGSVEHSKFEIVQTKLTFKDIK